MLQQYYQHYLQAIAVPQSRAFRLTLALIVAVGFLLRLHSWYTGQAYQYFTINDEVAALEQAFALLNGEPQAFYLGQPAFAGGNAPGPLWTLFTAGLYLLGGQSIQGALLVMVVFNTFAIYLVYRIARHVVSPHWTLLTTALFATSPWTVYYTTGLYNPMALGVLGALLLVSLWNVVTQPKSAHIFWVLMLAAAIPQFHMIGLFYLPAIVLVLWLTRVQLNIRWLIIGSLAGLLVYVPYLIGDALNQWSNTRDILSGGDEREFSWGVFKIITAPATILSNALGRAPGDGFEYYKELGNQYFLHYGVLLGINLISLLLGLYIFLLGFYRYLVAVKLRFWANQRNDTRTNWLLVGTLVYIPLLLFLPTGHNYAGRYAIIIFAPLFLLPAMVIGEHTNRQLAVRLTKLLVVFALVNVYIVIALYNHKGETLQAGEPFSPSFARLAQISRAVSGEAIPDERFRIVYSNKIRALPEGQFKLYRAAGNYLNLAPRGNKSSGGSLYFYLPGETPKTDTRIVYESHSLNIYR